MFNAFERAVAGRYLRARRGERFVSVIAIFSLIGIALGVATLIIVMSVMNGFKVDLVSRFLGLRGDLNIYGYGRPIDDYQAIAATVRKVRHVTAATPTVEGTVLMSSGPYSTGGLVHGVTQDDLRHMPAIGGNIIAGSLNDFSGDDVIAVGKSLAMQGNLDIGSKLTLVSPNGAATAFGTVPRVKAYRVVAVFDAGLNDYNTGVVFMPLAAAQIFFQLHDQTSFIQVMTDSPSVVREVTHDIVQQVEKDEPDARLRVLDWTQSNNALLNAVEVEQNVMFLILTLIILVAAFNVISSLIMMVKDKTRDIAVLRTIGAGRGAIMRIFLMCGAFVGVTGTALGTVLGIAFSLNIDRIKGWVQTITGVNLFNPEVYFLEHLPAKLIWSQVIEVIVMALALSLLATLYPSWRAARTDPVEALRHE
ncbi:lipoprotein-releasing ABC transporter permease subunit [Rhizosaccharibacter radicis]|uniref:Lipoprotein-releasing ABC transporter permease subunit n=1 Tax=Rhizosaccharibacter radicis TaxID=2782605 RepID=A0ABT1VZU4_9PROT|nr:lipoprotein-releasing ABC transporter permease subunit [Acetobacteraceae bacterium KSS12]